MRIPFASIAGAQRIAASMLVVGRYEIGHVGLGSYGFTVYGVDTWTGAPFRRTATTD